MTDDRTEMAEARTAGLRARHETREARAVRRRVAEQIAVAIETFLEDPHPPNGECETCALTHQLASVARRIGAEETPS